MKRKAKKREVLEQLVAEARQMRRVQRSLLKAFRHQTEEIGHFRRLLLSMRTGAGF